MRNCPWSIFRGFSFSIFNGVKFSLPKSLAVFVFALACLVQSTQAAPFDPPTWRDSAWDYRSEDSVDIKSEISWWKVGTFGGLALSSYAAAYVFVFAKGWWDNDSSHFHFENDFDYAMNLDKFGHFAAGVVMGETFYEGYRWAGLTEFQSYLFAGLSAMTTHIAIDVKDGFSPAWGFSIFDVLSGTIGGFWPMAERYVPICKYVDLKWSYWINSRAYYDKDNHHGDAVFTDDYVNQTFWASIKPYRLLPAGARKYYPSWLAFAAGLSINDNGMFQLRTNRHRELYFALDYDLEAFRPQSRMARTFIKYLNYFKLPAPTIQVYPEFHWYLLYPIKF